MFLTMKGDMLILFLTIYRLNSTFLKKYSGVDSLFEHLETAKERTHKPRRKMGRSHEQRWFAEREIQIKSNFHLVG